MSCPSLHTPSAIAPAASPRGVPFAPCGATVLPLAVCALLLQAALHNGLAVCHMKMGEWEDAERDLLEALGKDAKDADTLANLVSVRGGGRRGGGGVQMLACYTQWGGAQPLLYVVQGGAGVWLLRLCERRTSIGARQFSVQGGQHNNTRHTETQREHATYHAKYQGGNHVHSQSW